ncbi:esterase [Synechocystis sp. PCC 6803]|uniref:S-formylglutathione hydrolase n=1 Tax=Synechocystis sp. (strain ATCC 27184 / PCC 6803 / Kazusa) TaxID=1111708 RepID=P73137_SYNY3|nr:MULTISPECIES: S-formylglutathione hydrolase [unclassified Synechocystis]AGF50853.1 esterase [Synechocystis sp. PCC 6803]ALJ66902.1 S-formylglutathione hydrolase [Synechocystis sp. PCC 6803]AVP88747.1 S-formylglutathione hydrolase [Synechocystis sp. IPPAS B-1465]MBD2617255.1 S-formylglutathione hydrolase [Synechocystis sp. FACHB-898]MBD2639687.1 S-formylglutathione hydrolase [Synechocystis sp. FACHB-908]
MERLEHHASFGGWQSVYSHHSAVLNCTMNVGVYLPPQATNQHCPVLYWLSGLTCTEQNAITKSGLQQHAAKHGLIMVTPDTSPRGEGVTDSEDYDLGMGAGFYLNATQPPWAAHYQMHDYIVQELPTWIEANFAATDARSIFGHSMGGHGALVIALRNPGRYRSVSTFSPIVAPTQVPWGQKAFQAYLGDNQLSWQAWDTCALIKSAPERLPFFVDYGDADPFLPTQLRPELLQAACTAANHPLTLRMQPGYDHSYYFIASFIGDHMDWHGAALLN